MGRYGIDVLGLNGVIALLFVVACSNEAKELMKETKSVIYCAAAEEEKSLDPDEFYDCRESEMACKNEMRTDEECIPVTGPMYCMEPNVGDGPVIRRWCFSTDAGCLEEAGRIKANKELERKGLTAGYAMTDLLRDCFVLE